MNKVLVRMRIFSMNTVVNSSKVTKCKQFSLEKKGWGGIHSHRALSLDHVNVSRHNFHCFSANFCRFTCSM